MFEFEVCANGLRSAINANKAGVTRIELCAGMSEGGTTPSIGSAITTKAQLNSETKLQILIRPRGGDFCYDFTDLMSMTLDFNMLKHHADGFVLGILQKDGNLDVHSLQVFAEAAPDMSLTFHRAFDMCADPLKAIDQLAELGFDRILTSGGCATAEEGIPQLRLWQRHAEGKIQLMAGGGINEHNIRHIYEETGITAFHFSAREPIESTMEYRNPQVYMGKEGADEYVTEYTTTERVQRIINALVAGYN